MLSLDIVSASCIQEVYAASERVCRRESESHAAANSPPLHSQAAQLCHRYEYLSQLTFVFIGS